MEIEIFKKWEFYEGTYYHDHDPSVLVLCIESPKIDEPFFKAVYICDNGEYVKLNPLPKSRFKKANSVPSYMTIAALKYVIAKNDPSHPINDESTKLQVPGPQGQIAETKRRDFWCRTVIAYTGASNSVDSDKAITWADNCLKAFDKRFNNK